MEPISFRTPLALLPFRCYAIAGVWWWLATPITLARAPIDPTDKLLCVSYAPFRGAQTPLDPTTHIAAGQIAQDLAQLAKITECVRTYSIENGLDQVPALAAKVGPEGHAGHLARQQPRRRTSCRSRLRSGLAKEYPGVITSLSWSATKCCCAAR